MDARYVGAGSPRLAEGAQVARRPRSSLVRRAALVLATLAVATLALAARADAYVYWTNPTTARSGAPTSTARASTRASSPASARSPRGGGRRRPRLLDDWAPARSGAPTSTAPGRTRASSPRRPRPAAKVAVDGAHVYWVSKYSDSAPGAPTSRLPVLARSGAPTSTARASTRTSSAGLPSRRRGGGRWLPPLLDQLCRIPWSLTDRFPTRSGAPT